MIDFMKSIMHDEKIYSLQLIKKKIKPISSLRTSLLHAAILPLLCPAMYEHFNALICHIFDWLC